MDTGFMSRVTITVALAAVALPSALAVDFVQAAPKQAKVMVDNDKVRVLHVKFSKGDKIPMHSHPDLVVYSIKSGKIRFTTEDGKVREIVPKQGEAIFRPAVTHAHEHLEGDEAIVVELKK